MENAAETREQLLVELAKARDQIAALETQIQHAQKLESLSVVVGGIAHEASNLLVGILGTADLVLDNLSSHSSIREEIELIADTARRCAGLMRQMRAYPDWDKVVVENADLGNLAQESSVSKNASATIKANPDVQHGHGTVLLVDDEEIVRVAAGRALRSLGFTVATATDGESAIEVFKKHQVEIVCVLLDLTMPGMDGVQTLSALRRLDSNVPVLLSSGLSEVETTNRFAGKGFAGFIQKPYDLATLRTTFGRFCKLTSVI